LYINSKDSKILRDLAALKKSIHQLELTISDRQNDFEKLNMKLAQAMSLTSAHGYNINM